MESQKSMIEIAKEIVEKSSNGVKFAKLWEEVCQKVGLDEQKATTLISKFYTQLTMCGFLVQEKDNVWNLASRVSFEKSHIKIEDSLDEEEDANEGYNELDEGEAETLGNIAVENRQEENIDGQTEEEEEKPQEDLKLNDIIK